MLGLPYADQLRRSSLGLFVDSNANPSERCRGHQKNGDDRPGATDFESFACAIQTSILISWRAGVFVTFAGRTATSHLCGNHLATKGQVGESASPRRDVETISGAQPQECQVLIVIDDAKLSLKLGKQ